MALVDFAEMFVARAARRVSQRQLRWSEKLRDELGVGGLPELTIAVIRGWVE